MRKWAAMQFVEELGPFLRFSEEAACEAAGGIQRATGPTSGIETGVR